MMLRIFTSASDAPGSYFFSANAGHAASMPARASMLRSCRSTRRFGIVLSLYCCSCFDGVLQGHDRLASAGIFRQTDCCQSPSVIDASRRHLGHLPVGTDTTHWTATSAIRRGRIPPCEMARREDV